MHPERAFPMADSFVDVKRSHEIAKLGVTSDRESPRCFINEIQAIAGWQIEVSRVRRVLKEHRYGVSRKCFSFPWKERPEKSRDTPCARRAIAARLV